jgi:hypothetical protein
MKKLIHIASVLSGFALLLAAFCTQPSKNNTEETATQHRQTDERHV